MNDESNGPTRLFPRGVVTLTIAGMLERFGWYMAISTLVLLLSEKLWSDFDTAIQLNGILKYSAAFLPVLCGLIGDYSGHRRGLILGAAFGAGGLLLLGLPLEGDDGTVWLTVICGLLLLASGRAFFPVSTVALIGHLYDSKEHRVPSAGAFTLLHVLANVGALIAPFLAVQLTDLLADGGDLNRFEAMSAVMMLASQPMIVALILVASRRHLFAGVELAVREKARDVDAPPPPDGMMRYAGAMLPLLFAGVILFGIAYLNVFRAQLMLAPQAFDLGGELGFDLLSNINPMLIVFIGPVAIIVYGVLRGRGRAVPGALLAAIGMGVIAFGVLAMLPVVIETGGDPYAPEWGESGPSLFWPLVSISVLALGEILVYGLVPALVTSASPRRFRGLLYGVAFAASSLAALTTDPLFLLIEEAPEWIVFTVLAVVALIGAALVFVGGLIPLRRKS